MQKKLFITFFSNKFICNTFVSFKITDTTFSSLLGKIPTGTNNG